MKKRKEFNLKTISIILICFGALSFITALYFSPWVQNNRYVRAYNISREAEKYPVGSNEYLRLKAISEAVKKGQKNYQYSPSAPFLSPSL